ncbi:hypothetical protein [Anaerotignum propionicum]|uniref:hypothetical protein n=1 Tax=Anaerotignum propionicum TaxID=28446 RepID=UPI002B203DDD|nr:hypothetical protein [Anaerotignum propionicum]
MLSFLANSIRPHLGHGACQDESQRTGSTSTAAVPREYRLLAEKQGKPALATRYPRY